METTTKIKEVKNVTTINATSTETSIRQGVDVRISLSDGLDNRDGIMEFAIKEVETGYNFYKVLAGMAANQATAAALNELSEKDSAGAVSRLRPLATAENPHLAAESSFFLAKAYIQQDDYEQALPLLEELIAKHSDHSLRVGEALFLRGISQMHVLRRVEAMTSFGDLLQQHPNAPAPILAAARQNLELLEQLELGSIADIHDQTQYSHRRLSLERSGKETQDVQDHIVAMLTSLIDEMEKCCGKCPGCGCCQGGRKSGGGQGGATPGISSGTSTAARRVQRGGTRTPWADLANKAREARAFTAMKTKFPARYRQLVEQYYRSLQEETEP